MATKNTILGTVPKSRGRYTEGDTTTKWYYDNILEYKGSSFRCISEASTGITGAPATYNSGTHTLVPNAGWEFFIDTTGALDVGERFTENEEKLSELENDVYDINKEISIERKKTEVSIYKDHSYFAPTGYIATYEPMAITNEIIIHKGQVLFAKISNTETACAIVKKKDNSYVPLVQGIESTWNNPTIYEYRATELNEQIYICYRKDLGISVDILASDVVYDIYKDIDQIEKDAKGLGAAIDETNGRVEQTKQDIIDVKTNVTGISQELTANELKTYNNTKDLISIKENFIEGANKVFGSTETFDTSSSQGTNFNGFASIYTFNGLVDRIDVNGIFRSEGNDITVHCEILDEQFTTILKSSTVTVSTSDNSRALSFPINYLFNGRFYIRVYSEGGYFLPMTAGTSSQYAGDASHTNYYRLANQDAWAQVGDGTYWIQCMFFVKTYKDKSNNHIINIGHFDGADYREIQEALVDITDDAPDNVYTLLIHPSAVPYKAFTTVRRSFNENLPSTGVTPRYISIIGLDKAHCTIKSDKGDYYYPAAEIAINGIIKNINFIMTHENLLPNTTEGGYAVHIDCETVNEIGHKVVFEDCYFYSNTGPGIGIGTHQNVELEFNRCEIVSEADPLFKPTEGYMNIASFGAAFCHSAVDPAVTNQKIAFKDCICTNKLAEGTLNISSNDAFSPNMLITLINNTFYSYKAERPGVNLPDRFTYSPLNHGNNF